MLSVMRGNRHEAEPARSVVRRRCARVVLIVSAAAFAAVWVSGVALADRGVSRDTRGGAKAASGTEVAAKSSRTCRSVRARGRRFRVTIVKGSVRCRTARRILRAFFSGKGVKHGGPSNAQTYWTLGRWRCGTGTGGGGCIRGGRDYRVARHYILGIS